MFVVGFTFFPPFAECSHRVLVRLQDSDIYFLARWTVSGDSLSFRVSANTDGWIGIGFSVDELMVSSSYLSDLS